MINKLSLMPFPYRDTLKITCLVSSKYIYAISFKYLATTMTKMKFHFEPMN